MISADSLAISTAESTEMPQSLARMAAASLMPSPIKPTVWPSISRMTRTRRAFCSGESLAKRWVFSARSASSASSSASISEPSKTLLASIPICSQTVAATRSLSPVRTLTATPLASRVATAPAALALGGSRKAKKPISTMSHSSAMPNSPTQRGLVFCATAITRRPSALSPAICLRIWASFSSVSG